VNINQIFLNISWLVVDKIIRGVGGVLVSILVAKHLGPDHFGLYNYSAAFVALFSAIAGFGLQEIVVRDIICKPNLLGQTIGSAGALLFFGGLFSIILAIVAINIVRPHDGASVKIISILVLVNLFKPADVALYWFASRLESKSVVIAQDVVFLVLSVAKIIAITRYHSLVGLAWVSVGESLLCSIIVLYLMIKKTPMFQRIICNFDRVTAMLGDSWALLLSTLAVAMYMKIDQIMLGEMLGNKSVGIYSAAVRISEIWYFIPMVIVSTVYPVIIKKKVDDELEYKKSLQGLYDIIVVSSFAVALPMTLIGPFIISRIYGAGYEQSSAILTIHIWASVFVFLGVASSKWFIAENLQILGLQRTVLGLILNIILNLFLIPKYGPVGAATATVVSQAFSALLFDLLQAQTQEMFRMKVVAINPTTNSFVKYVFRIKKFNS
jgi:O-antigen/teichoic acid export membrane protein